MRITGVMLSPAAYELLRRAAGGDDGAIARLFERHRSALKRAVSARVDERIAARLDASDVV
jgi:RNA polymerase sigma-70 factor, ECF subfamily